jgi:hypothetical protein
MRPTIIRCAVSTQRWPNLRPPVPERADDQIAVIVLTNRSDTEAGTLGLEVLIRLLPPVHESGKK